MVVVSPGTVVASPPGTVVEVAAVAGTEEVPESRLGRRNHTSDAVTMITANDASTAMTTRSRGGCPCVGGSCGSHRFSTLPMMIDPS